MKNFWLAGLAVTTLPLAGFAQAADLKTSPVYKAPLPLIASSWTGFYAGLGLGFRASRTDAALSSETGPITGSGFSLPFDGVAFRTSPYVGFNWQIAPRWVAGIESDFGFAGQTTIRGGVPVPAILTEVDLSGADSLSVKTTWDSSLRGRVGYLLTPTTLVYATGGVAWQHYELTSTCGCSGAGLILTPTLVTNSSTKAGWTLGGGLETALWGHWFARAEYRYADFGTGSFSIARAGSISGSPAAFADNFDIKLHTHTATLGLAYKFGDPVADDPGHALGATGFSAGAVAASWSGAYAGLGLGARVSREDLTTRALSTGGAPADLSALSTSQPLDGTGFRVSPYVGFIWRLAPQWVAGFEGDFGVANHTTRLPGYISPTLRTFDANDAFAVKTTWDASLRGRLGFLLTSATLVYATGGVAWQHYDVTSTCASTQCSTVTTTFFPVTGGTVSNSSTLTGWTAGGGIETALWDHWLARAEYRYADFGSDSFTVARSSSSAAFNPTIENIDVKLRTHTFTFGLAYKFN